LEFGLLIH